tara:strand:+ start:645 stop:899 length:255 start_codon:yes stop_codon:yes gene_type:complete
MFKLTDDELGALDSFKSHCEYTIECITDFLNDYEKGIVNGDTLGYIHAENTRGIDVIADYNIMHNQLRTIQELEKRYSEYENNL